MGVKRAALALVFFGGLAVLGLHSLLVDAGTRVGATLPTDYYHFHWNYWWIRHALTTPGLSVYETNFVLFPYTTNLALHTLTPFWYPLWALLEPLTGTIAAMNIIYTLAMALTGWSCYLLLRQEGGGEIWLLVGGVIYMFTPAFLLAIFIGNPNYAGQFWYPVQLLIWTQVARARTMRGALLWGVGQGAAFYAMLMTDFQHLLFVAFLLVPYGLLTLLRAQGGAARLRLIGAGVVAVGLAFALLWFAGPLPALLVYDRSGLSPQAIESATGIPFPLGYVWRESPYTRRVTLGAFVLPLMIAALALALIRRRHISARTLFWLALVIVPALLALGPSIQIGERHLPTPYVLLHQAFGGLFRSPARFSPIIALAALLVSIPLLSRLIPARKMGRYGAAAGMLLIALAESRAFEPMPVRPAAAPYEFYRRMGEERGAPYDEYAVVEVPVAGGSGEAWVGEFPPMELQFYGMIHGKRMLNGSIARAPLGHFWYWLVDDPMLAWLGQRRHLEPERVEAQLRERIFDWPIGYLVIHQDLVGRIAPTNQEIIGYFNQLDDLLCPVWVERDAVVYRTAWHPDGCPSRTPPQDETGVYVIDIGAAGDERFIGWGWHWAEEIAGLRLRWTGQYPETRLYADLPPQAYTLILTAQSFWQPRTLTVEVNGTMAGETVTVTVDALRDYAFSIPVQALGDGDHIEIILRYDEPTVPAEVGQSADTRPLALLVDSVRFEPRSSGAD